QADYAAANTDAINAQTNFQRMEMLVHNDTVSRQQYDNAKATRDSTAQRAESLHQRLALLQAGTRKEDLLAARERYSQAQAAAELMQRGYRKEDIDAGRAKFEEAQARVNQLDVQTRDDRQHQVFGVKVRVDNPDGALKSGMSATVRLQ